MISSNDSRTFELLAGHPALDLVNTLDWRFRETGSEELLAGYDDLLRFAAQSELVTPKQIRKILRATSQQAAADALVSCRQMREAAAEILYATLDRCAPPPGAIKTLERFIKEALTRQHLVFSAHRLRWELPAQNSSADLPFWLLTLSVAQLLVSEEVKRLRMCGNPECRWLFLDTSKNRKRRWCDMKVCGNRMKARRFQSRGRGS